jgi:two-component system, LuxR family, sensor kinase FixL
MSRLEEFLLLSDENRPRVYAIAAVLSALIAWIDWKVESASLGFLYIVPILLASATLKGWHILGFAILCGILRELFNPLHPTAGAPVRMIIGAAGFTLAGFFVSELYRKRQMLALHLREREEEMRLRQEAQQQLRVLVDTSPLAILTLDSAGKVLLANDSAQQVLANDGQPLPGQSIGSYLPILERVLAAQRAAGNFRTTVETKGQRANGEVFLAHIWLSTYPTPNGLRLAAFIWDASENLRDREGTGLDSMITTSRIVIGAVSHEIRNLASAAVSAHAGLALFSGVKQTDSFQALGTIINALEKIAASGLKMAADYTPTVADLGMVLDETRVVIESSFRDSQLTIEWKVADGLPLVAIDQNSLLQVFLNLARNCQQAMAGTSEKMLTVETSIKNDLVMVTFSDTGPGISNPDNLFKPFQPGAHSTGLGLYISRAVVRAHGGDLRYERLDHGSCFSVQLWPAEGHNGDRR